jgi:CheY-like chemotaxis protein
MNAKVLLVDDEPAVLRCMATALTRFGFSVTAASSGRAALEHIARESFDLVVTDYRMPDIMGDAVVREARERQPEAALLLVTGFADELPSALRSGPTSVPVLAKPFSLLQLRDAAEAALRRSPALAF